MVPKDQPFPKYARDYFAQLQAQYQLLLEESSVHPRPSVAKLIADSQQAPDSVTWADVFTLETAYLYALADSGDLDRLRAEVLYMRKRYRDIIGPVAYVEYAQSVSADVSKLTLGELRAELMALAERMRYIYTFVPPKEAIRNKMAMDAAWWTLGAIVFGLVIYAALWSLTWAVITILVVAFVGEMGGFLSLQQRLQSSGGDDPLYKELLLTNGWFSVVVIAPISGAVFAIVLYFIFVGGLMTGGLFPRFGPLASDANAASSPTTSVASSATALGSASPTAATSSQTSPMNVTVFLKSAEPSEMQDWGKLLAWAFVAGFAERFVPDVLSRLTGQSSVGSAKPVPVLAAGVGQPGNNQGGGGQSGNQSEVASGAEDQKSKEQTEQEDGEAKNGAS
jgi:hypothetical protein